MLLIRLWNYIRGYVIILVESYFLEKFINICTHRQIFLWDIKKHKNCRMTIKVSIQGFKMMRPIAKKTKCRVRIVRKKGLPFISYRYKRRKSFVVGAVLFVALIYFLTSFIWVVEISGNKKLETGLLNEKLASLGVKPGILKYRIDTEKVVNDMMLDLHELAWVSVAVRGTKVKVQVVERVKPPEILSNVPCDIVAKKDGVIKSIVVKDGQEKVKVGDTVTKGQILISGAINIKNEAEKSRLVHAIGTVKARTWYEARVPVNFTAVEKVRTGKTKDSISLLLFAKRINLYASKVEFENYDKIEIRKRISIGEDLIFPFELIIDRFYENSLNEKDIDAETAKQAAADSALESLKEKVPEDAEVVRNDLDFLQDENGAMTAVVTMECLEDIGIEQKMGGE